MAYPLLSPIQTIVLCEKSVFLTPYQLDRNYSTIYYHKYIVLNCILLQLSTMYFYRASFSNAFCSDLVHL